MGKLGGHDDGQTGGDTGAAFPKLIGRLDYALRDLGDRSALNKSPLARMSCVEKLANEAYRGQLLPKGLAVRSLVAGSVERVCSELGNEPGLVKPCRYLRLRADGHACRDISRQLGLSREHVSRVIRTKALQLLAQAFMALTQNEAQHGSGS